jgi:hypothetical protein
MKVGSMSSIQIGDLVELRAAHRIQKFRSLWDHTGVLVDIYVADKGKFKGQTMAKIFFSTTTYFGWGELPRTVTSNKTLKILLKRFKKAR